MFINTSYFFEVGPDGKEARFRLFSLEHENEHAEEEHPDDAFEGVQLEAADEKQYCETLRLGGSVDMPEYRTVNLRHTYDKGEVRVTIKSPVPQRRVFSKTLFANYCIAPENGEEVRAAIRQALRETLKGGVLVSALSAPSSALPAYTDMVHKALENKGVMVSGALKLGLFTEKRCGPWQSMAKPQAAEALG